MSAAVADEIDVTEVAELVVALSDNVEKLRGAIRELSKEKDNLTRELAAQKTTMSQCVSASVRANSAAAEIETKMKQFAQLPQLPGGASEDRAPAFAYTPSDVTLADFYKGKLEAKSAWSRGDLWMWHGSLFIALRAGSGTENHPYAKNRSGKDPAWVGLVNFGSGNPIGATTGIPGTPGTFNIVSRPAATNSPGVPGQVAFDSGFIYFCTAANTWLQVAGTTVD